MILANRNLITIDDFSNKEIEAIFKVTDEISGSIDKYQNICQGKIMASLFFEPSTRTRLSFETAMHRLGGNVISVADAKATSLTKGETLADMARIIGGYADIIVIRHPLEGAAKVFSDYAGIPVINAGDGGHEHPTQTLCDLYTIKKERQSIKGLKIALWGDLKYGRTIHSLAYALARFGATILFRPGPNLDLPEYVIRKLTIEYGGEFKKLEVQGQKIQEKSLPLNAIYLTPSSPHQLAMMPDISVEVELKTGVDALYVTRFQTERYDSESEKTEFNKDYPIVDKKLLRGKEYKQTLVMHPLPRVDELAYEIDTDTRSLYFKQAAEGVPIRMALIALLLGVKDTPIIEGDDLFIPKSDCPIYRGIGIQCSNPTCVSIQKTEKRYIKSEFKILSNNPITLRCVYCEHEVHPQYIASSDWHQGKLENKKYHKADSHLARKIKIDNLIFFNSENDAIINGFKPSYFAGKTNLKSTR